MGSPWNKRRTEDDEHGIDRLGAPPTKPGLGAAELDLLRQAPDYDAEEMASVRLSGGWPAPLAQPGRSLAPAGAAAQPAAPSWLPPNRIEPPARGDSPTERAAPAPPARAQFPEERTMALMAEDLLGRSLDEPAPTVEGSVRQPGSAPAAWSAPPAAGGADVWDAAMPLVAEG